MRKEQREGEDMLTVIDRHDVRRLIEQGAQLVDVMSAREYDAEHIPRAINLPLKTLTRETAERIDLRRAIIVYCHDYQ
jgi:phage shock protein E